MPDPNSTWRVNSEGMERCCRMAVEYEMYRRKKVGEELMIEGDTLKCETCNAQMICSSDGPSKKLRWRWNGGAE